ncbi:MAG: FAD-dependent oxidoreductase [Ruminococcaceae bacterium]|nr:FAD-dependent oxidoreductase [Oscillospiraceae bacterium]
MNKIFREEACSIPVYAECDVLVVGGGAAGHSAAIAAARAGAKNVILMERYGYMGGDVTGGYVIMLPNLSWYNKSFIRGLQEEWFTRLEKIPGAMRGPALKDIGSTEPALVHHWKSVSDAVSRGTYGGCKPSCLVRSVFFEPNYLKIEMDKMLLEHSDRIRVLCHSWGTKPIIEDNRCKGVIFESKEGRQAVMAKVVIDATGDGDLYTKAGVPFQSLADGETRSSTTALVWRVAGIDWNAYHEWRTRYPEVDQAFKAELKGRVGFRSIPIASNSNDMCWINNWHADRDCSRIDDQTFTEMHTRATIYDALDYMREAVPAFRNAYLYDIAPQLGCRCSKRLTGEYVMTANDFAFASKFDDVIAWSSTICQINDCGPVEIPYRAILPQKVDNLLAPGRHLSADNVAIDWVNLIPQCVQTGQAAGVAAAVAVAEGTGTHDVNIAKVQDILVEQDVPLPRNEKFRAKDPSYEELVEEKQYGLYTDMAKAAREEADKASLKKFRQW